MLHDGFLRISEGIHNTVVHMTFLGEDLNLLGSLLQRLYDLLVGLFLVQLLLLLHCVLLAGIGQLVLELLYNVKVGICDLLIVLLDFLVLLGMFVCQGLDRCILLSLNHGDGLLSSLLHFFTEEKHLMLEFGRDFVGYALELPAHLGRTLI
jgi:hypothetical protein